MSTTDPHQPRTSRAAFEIVTDLPFDEAVQRCRAELAKEGFGVLTEIDIQAKLKEKLKVDVEPNLILGACHPPSAYRALQAEPEVGVLLPCNVTVSIEDGRTVIRAMNPGAAMQVLQNPAVEEVAAEVGSALRRVLTRVATT
jgi:uncharacterized protein (DUF302 family)